MPILIYKIIFLITAFGAGVIAVNVFLRRESRTRFEILFGLMSAAFVLWAAGRFVFLFSENTSDALFWAHFLYNGSILVHSIFLHTILVFLEIDKHKINKFIIFTFYTLSAFLLFFNDMYFVNGQSYFIVDAVPKLGFSFYEVPGKLYLLHLINYIFIPTYCLVLMIRSYFKFSGEKKQQVKWLMWASFVGFIGGNSVVPLVYGIKLEPFLLVLVPFYLPALTYAIAKRKLFSMKIISAEIFIFSLWTFILVRIFLSENLQEQLINIGLLTLVIVVSIFLIRSIHKEVLQREKIEKLAIELERANERLKELDNLKSEFVSLASHQIRGPIAAIKGYASEILEGDFGELPKHLESPMKTVFHSCESLANIVEDFLNISRIEQGRMKYELSEFVIGDIVAQVLEELKPTFDQKGLAVEKMIDDGIMVKADKGKIKQIINNIIDNSIKYTPKGGISVRLEKNDGNALITVKDTGIGINPKTIPKLFQKFSRAEDAAKANIMGTGLGLYVASQMIKAQGGHIWVESDGDGKGSTFFIELKAIN